LIFVFGGEARDGLPKRIGTSAVERHVQCDFARQTVDGQITGYREFVAGACYAPTLERHRWILRDIEEIGRTQVLVPLRIARDQVGYVDGDFDRRPFRVLGGVDNSSEIPVNRALTLDNIMCRTLNSTRLWAGSTCHADQVSIWGLSCSRRW
jgi:hypothetical protein